MSTSIAHVTSAHSRFDTRIFLKMCSTIVKNDDYNVSLVVADGKGNEEREKIVIIDTGAKSGGRLSRMTKTVALIKKKCIELNADIYHLHDPELIPLGRRLKKNKKLIIFDAHEDIPKQILCKQYLPPFLRRILSLVFSVYEKRSLSRFDLIVTATQSIYKRYTKWHPHVLLVNNYPIVGELESTRRNRFEQRPKNVIYIGGISAIRGITEMIHAMELTTQESRLQLVGTFESKKLYADVKNLIGWGKVVEHGFLNRKEVKELLSSARCGLVLFHPVPNHLDSQPNKLFEYMSAGIPVICSDFPLWKQIVLENECGICVDPLIPNAIAKAIDWIVDHPKEAESMGRNGQLAILNRYNWDYESKELLGGYSKLLACQSDF